MCGGFVSEMCAARDSFDGSRMLKASVAKAVAGKALPTFSSDRPVADQLPSSWSRIHSQG